MDGILNTTADARRRLGNSADGVQSVVAFLVGKGDTDKATLDAIEILGQAERILRRVHIPEDR